MKILHTSDLHLGRNLKEESLYDDQKYMLDEIIDVIKEQKVDVVIIAGDIYDKSIPSVDAVNLFNDFLDKLADLKTETIIISGNHDSNERLAFGSNLFGKLNIHIETEYTGKMKKYSYNDVDIYTLPFIKPFHLKNLMKPEEYEKISSANEMMKWVLSQEKIDKSKKNILVMHQFVMNNGEKLELSDSEIAPSVGTLDSIDANLLDDFDYVALGHIHKPQFVKRETIRYSGSPLKYSFSEVNNKNGVVLYDTDKNSIAIIPLKSKRNMQVLKGSFEEVMKMEPSDDLIKVILTDENELISPMDELRKRFPNIMDIKYENRISNLDFDMDSKDITERETPLSLFSKFYQMQNGRELNEDEIKYFNKTMEEIKYWDKKAENLGGDK